MKRISLVILIALFASCTNAPKNAANKNIQTNSDESEITDAAPSVSPDLQEDFSKLFLEAVSLFPEDSVSLYRFYYKWHPAKDADHLKRQINRLEMLTSEKSVERYNNVADHLKVILTQIVSSNDINKSQVDRLGNLYSDYDYFSGEALLSRLLTGEDNYNLVWRSFQLMAMESSKDTSYMSRIAVRIIQVKRLRYIMV